MSPSLYTHTFTWPPTPSQSVVVTGTFDNWSGDRHHLYKNEAKGGYWEGTVDIPFGEKVAYKYVVDGNWLIREDEAKEWDAAGNMNNIFSAPSRTDAQSDSHPTSTGAVSSNDATTTTGTGLNDTHSVTDSANTVGSGSRDLPVTNNLSSTSPTTTATSTSPDHVGSSSHAGLAAGGLGAAGLAGAGAAGLAGASRSSHSGVRDESSVPVTTNTAATTSPEKREIGTGVEEARTLVVAPSSSSTTSPVHANEHAQSTEHKNLTSSSTDHSTEHKKESLIEKAKHLVGGHHKSTDSEKTHHDAATTTTGPSTAVHGLSRHHHTAGEGHSEPILTGGVLSDYVGNDRSATGDHHGLAGSSSNTTGDHAVPATTGAHATPATTGLNSTSLHSDSHAPSTSVPTTSSSHGALSSSSGDKDRSSSGPLLEAGRVAQGESTKAGNDLLGGLALGAPIGGGSGAGLHTTTTTYATNGVPSTFASGLEPSTSAREFMTGSTGPVQTGATAFSNNTGSFSDRAGAAGVAATTAAATSIPAGLAGLAPSHTHEQSASRKEFEGLAPSHTHEPATTGSGPLAGLNSSDANNTHEPSSPLKALAQATSPILGSTAGTTTSAAHIDAKTVGSAHHEPADALKSLAAATSPVLGSTAGSTTEKAHHEIENVGHTPAQPLKELANSTSSSLGLGSSITGAKTGNATPAGANTTTTESHGLAETVTLAGTSVLGALTVAATGLLQGANEVVHNATGVDLLHGDPLTVQEAKEKGIDPVTGQPIASSATAGSAAPLTANRNSTTSTGALGGLGAPVTGSVTGPSPAAFAAPVSTGLAGGPGTAAPLGSATGPTPAQVGGVAPLGSSSSPSHVAAPSAAPVVAATSVPSAAVVAAPAQSAAASSGRSANSIGSNTREATASRPAEAKSVDVFSSNDTKAKKEPGANDIPSQEETRESNHKKVPQPMITNIGEVSKDRTRPTGEEAGVPISSRPDADVKGVAQKEEQNKRAFPHIEGVPSRSYAKQGDTNKPLAGLPLGTTQQPLAADVAPATPTKVSAPVPVNNTMGAAPATPVRAGDNVPVAAGTPATPASRVLDRETKTQPSTPDSMTSSTAGGHRKEESSDSMRKRKSSFFTKIKSAFHKDKKDKV